jgi:hypothetical protein
MNFDLRSLISDRRFTTGLGLQAAGEVLGQYTSKGKISTRTVSIPGHLALLGVDVFVFGNIRGMSPILANVLVLAGGFLLGQMGAAFSLPKAEKQIAKDLRHLGLGPIADFFHHAPKNLHDKTKPVDDPQHQQHAS